MSESSQNPNTLTGNPTHFQQVGEFHLTFGHPLRTSFYYDALSTDRKLADFRLSLMREELKEFQDAYEKNDRVEMADALCDLLYVTYGAGHVLGIDLDQVDKNSGYDIKSAILPIGKDGTEISYFLGVVAGHLAQYNQYMDLNNFHTQNYFSAIELILRALPKSKNDQIRKDLVFGNISGILEQILYLTYGMGNSLNFNMDLMFREVHRSNMTKVCDNEDDAKASVEFYVKDGRYKDPQYRLQGKYYVIYDASTSKILKNHRWENPNLKQFLTIP